MKIPDWLQTGLASFENSQMPFMEVSVFEAIRDAANGAGALTEEEQRVTVAEWAAFGFIGRPSKDSPWGTYFAPMMSATRQDGREVRQPDIADLDAAAITHWEERAQSAKDPVMRARYADAAWDLKKTITGQAPSYTFAQIAIDAYVEAGDRRRFTMEIEAVAWLRRALDLSLSLRDLDRAKRVAKAIFDFYDAVAVPGQSGVWVLPFDCLYGRKDILAPEQEARIITDLEAMLGKTTMPGSSFEPFGAQAAAERLAQHYRRVGDAANVRRVITSYGGAFSTLSNGANAMLATAWLQPIIERYEQEGFKEEAEELQLLVAEKAKNIESEMKTVSVPVEIKKEEVDKLLDELTADDLATSLRRVAVYFIPKVEELKGFLDRMRKATPLLSLIPVTRIDDEGRPIGRIGSVDEDPEGRLHQQIGRSIQFQQPFLVAALDLIKEKYHPAPDDVLKFLKESPIFLNSDDKLLSQGLDAYSKGDYVKAIHVLVPQVEQTLRGFLALLGIPTVKSIPRHPGVLDVKSMNDVLEDGRVRTALTENLWRYLTVLYIDRKGGLNLRNDLAHGLVKEAFFNRAIADLVIHSLLALSLVRAADKKKETSMD